MDRDEWYAAWQKTTGLWPRWNPTTAIEAAWSKAFGGFRFDPFVAAVEEHWQDANDRYEPAFKALLKLCRDKSVVMKPPEQKAFEDRFYSMSKLDQNRHIAASHRSQAARAEDPGERAKHEGIAATAEDAVKRLTAIEKNRKQSQPVTRQNIFSLLRVNDRGNVEYR